MRANGIVDDASATPSTSRRWRLAAAVTLAGRSDGRSAAANCARVSLGVDTCCARIGIRSLDQATLEGAAPSAPSTYLRFLGRVVGFGSAVGVARALAMGRRYLISPAKAPNGVRRMPPLRVADTTASSDSTTPT